MSAPTKRGVVVGAAMRPQINLLPPEVRASRSLRATKRLLVISVVGVVAVAGAGYVGAMLMANQAEGVLAEEQAETQRLLAAQREYSEVPQVLGNLDRAEEARLMGMSTEILWQAPMTQLMQVSPDGVVFSRIETVGATPMQPAPTVANPLHAASVITLTFEGASRTLPDTAAWIDALETIPGFQDAFVTSAGRTEASGGLLDGEIVYDIRGTVQISDAIYAARFAAEQEG